MAEEIQWVWLGMLLLSAGALSLLGWLRVVAKMAREDRLTLERVRVEVDSLRAEAKGLAKSQMVFAKSLDELRDKDRTLEVTILENDKSIHSLSKFADESNHEFEDLQKRVRSLEEKMPKPASTPKKGKRR